MGTLSELMINNIPTDLLLLSAVSSENKDFLKLAWKRKISNDDIYKSLQVVCESGQTEMVIQLLERSSNLEIGKQIIWAACRSGKLEIIKALLDRSDIKISKTEIEMLQRYGHYETIEKLI
jgi:ankyrin repeat protein